ncbi:MAG: hypothetical protein IMZ55_00250 [Acidobacteria bacterium]|nr:hypothetical protein [Acidobacteriota bacterium]
MRIAAQIASGLALGGTILPAVLFFTGRLELDQVKVWMLAATVVWFVATPLWMDRQREH